MIPREEELVYRSRWFVWIRWVVALIMGLGVWGSYLLELPYALGPLLKLPVAVVLYNAMFAAGERWVLARPVRLARVYRFVNLQIVTDFLVLLAWIHYTGGPVSPFLPFFIFHLLICGLLVSPRTTLLHACWVVLALGLMGVAEASQWIPHYSPIEEGVERPIESRSHLVAIGVVTAATLLTVAVLVGGIAQRLRRREQQLDQARQELEKHSAQVEAAHAELERLAGERNSFFRMVGHQLRSPLTSIQTVLRLVTSGSVEEKEKITELVGRADRQAQHMLSLINDLLSLTRIKSAQAAEKRESIAIGDLLRDVVEGVENAAEEKGVKVSVEIESGLPNVLGVRQKLHQLFTVLVDNAVKYTSSGGEVKVKGGAENQAVRVVVEDTGIGIPPEARSKVFEEFFRAPNARKHIGAGTGLGLSIAKSIAEEMDGSIECESEVGKGTSFTVKLPGKNSD